MPIPCCVIMQDPEKKKDQKVRPEKIDTREVIKKSLSLSNYLTIFSYSSYVMVILESFFSFLLISSRRSSYKILKENGESVLRYSYLSFLSSFQFTFV